MLKPQAGDLPQTIHRTSLPSHILGSDHTPTDSYLSPTHQLHWDAWPFKCPYWLPLWKLGGVRSVWAWKICHLYRYFIILRCKQSSFSGNPVYPPGYNYGVGLRKGNGRITTTANFVKLLVRQDRDQLCPNIIRCDPCVSFKVSSSFYLCAWKNKNISVRVSQMVFLLRLEKLTLFVRVHLCVDMCVHVSAVVCRAQKTLAALELEIQVVVRCPPWAPQRAVCTLDC